MELALSWVWPLAQMANGSRRGLDAGLDNFWRVDLCAPNQFHGCDGSFSSKESGSRRSGTYAGCLRASDRQAGCRCQIAARQSCDAVASELPRETARAG